MSDLTRLLLDDAPGHDVELKLQRATLDILCAAASPVCHNDPGEIGALWADEAEHRAMTFFRLALWLKRSELDLQFYNIVVQNRYHAAARMAAAYQSVQRVDLRRTSSCRRPLVELAIGLTSFFSLSPSSINLSHSVDDISISPVRLRALVLIASELIMHTLEHAFEHGLPGNLAITLKVPDKVNASFGFEDNVVAPLLKASGPGHRIVARLSGLLRGELVYKNSTSGGTRVEISFRMDDRPSRSALQEEKRCRTYENNN